MVKSKPAYQEVLYQDVFALRIVLRLLTFARGVEYTV